MLVNAKNQRKLYREDCGFVFQNFALIDTQTVRQNLHLGLAKQKLAKTVADAKMKAALNQVGLASLPLKQKIYTLSGGDQQRVALARIILKDPKIVFADEPTGSLDKDNAQIVLKTLLTNFGSTATVIIATYDPAVWQLCDYIIKIANKKIFITSKEICK